MITGLAYPIWSLAGSVAYTERHPFVDAFFESASAITTTGLSALPEHGLGYAELFVRAWLQWVGGAGIAVLSVTVVGGVAAVALYSAERGRTELIGSVLKTARVVTLAYVALSLVVCTALALTGLPWPDAVLYSLATLSTGGFQPSGQELLHGAPTTVLVLGMVLGATPLILYRKPRQLVMDAQVRTLLTVMAVAWFVNWFFTHAAPLDALFSMVTAMTTSGFTLDDATSWPSSTKAMALVLMVVGGSAGSTAGGAKLFRVAIAFTRARVWVFRQLVPQEATLSQRYGGHGLTDTQVTAVLMFLASYLFTLVVGVIGLAAAGLSLEEAAFGSASALGTVGLWIGPSIESLPLGAKALLILLMWAGRVELLPLLLVLYPPAWRPRRRPVHALRRSS